MPPSELIDLVGAKELDRALSALDAKVARKVAGKALRAGAAIIEAEAKRTAPVRTGALRNAIRIVPGKNKKDYKSVKVAVGEKWFTGDQFYAAFQEFGWKTGKRGRKAAIQRQNKGQAERREVPGKHYMQAAYEAKAVEATDAIMSELAKGIVGNSAAALREIRAQKAARRAKRINRKIARQQKAMTRTAKRLRKMAKKQAKALKKASKRGFKAGKKQYKALRRKFG